MGRICSLTRCPAIPSIQEKAKLYKGMVRHMRVMEDYRNPFWTEEENIEMAVRVLVRGDFSDLLGNSLLPPDLQKLERALFNVVYPSLG